MSEQLREKCAVGGVQLVDHELGDASVYLYETLLALQHRGHEASGIASKHSDGLAYHRDLGMVKDVYDQQIMNRLRGSIAIGHGKYTTSNTDDDLKRHHLQPVIDSSLGLAIAHNGNIPDTSKLDEYLFSHGLQHGHGNDSEKMGYTIGQFMRGGQDFPTAIKSAAPLMQGAYSCVGVHDNILAAFRDPKGIRPLALGMFDENWVVSSETCGLDILNAKYVREVEPGELVLIDENGKLESIQLVDDDEIEERFDIFEYVYFARRDSKLHGQTVDSVRVRLGEQLAEEHGTLIDDTSDTIVVPVPATSLPIAKGYAQALGLPIEAAIEKNDAIGRTFMAPSPEMRTRQLRRKHNIIADLIKGKDVILVDDSIVRLNTVPNLVKRAYTIGAKSVSVLVGSPPIRFPDFYGIDTPNQEELAAFGMTVDEIRKHEKMTGPKGKQCKYLGYLSLSRMVKATGLPASRFSLSSFNGDYPIDIGARRKDIKTPVSMEYIDL
jgi:amidophosphoribosyltransferase